MPKTNGGPPCPKPERVRELIEIIGESELVDQNVIKLEVEHDLIDALDWLATMLENRSLYHKKQQIKNKVIRNLAKEYGLEGQADVITKDLLHSFVTQQPPSKDEVEIEFPHGDDDDNTR